MRPRTRNHLVVVVGIFVACRCCGLSAKCFHIASCCLQCLCAPFGGVSVVHCRVVSCAVGCVCTYFLTCLGPVNRSAFSTKPTLRKTPLQRRVCFFVAIWNYIGQWGKLIITLPWTSWTIHRWIMFIAFARAISWFTGKNTKEQNNKDLSSKRSQTIGWNLLNLPSTREQKWLPTRRVTTQLQTQASAQTRHSIPEQHVVKP